MLNRVPVTPDAAQSTLQQRFYEYINFFVSLRKHSLACFQTASHGGN